MRESPASRVRSFWRRLSRLDQVALVIAVLYGLVWLARLFHREPPLAGFTGFLFFLSLGYSLYRFFTWVRVRLLWSLRNRLIVAYIFIAVVPIILLLSMAALSAFIIYPQLGANLLEEELQKQVERVADAAADAAAVAVAQKDWSNRGNRELPELRAALSLLAGELPGLQIDWKADPEMFKRQTGLRRDRFGNIVRSGESLQVVAAAMKHGPQGPVVVSATVPVTSELLDRLAPFLGPMQLVLTAPAGPGDAQKGVFSFGGRQFRIVGRIGTRNRVLQPAGHWFDREMAGLSKLEALAFHPAAEQEHSYPVFASFSFRPSQINGRLFSSLGEFGGVYFQFLVVIGIVFLVLEAAALATGIVLTRTITQAVADLYEATQYVQAGDLSHRVRVRQRDQLGALGESFNSMTSSISVLIEEQRQKQKLENEISIAREVQEQLFPRQMPSVPGLQVEAICRAARMVSGDYYDFIHLGPTRLGIALADICGKGISAALLMASLQAALRSQVQLDGGGSLDTADLVSRINRHLLLNSGEDRFATFFYAVYDSAARTLRYTNAGHLPPLYIVGERVTKLEQGGTVVGIIENAAYEQGTVSIEPGALLLAYSDGMTEPENVYGEEFGTRRLVETALRHRHAAPRELADTLMAATEEWAGTPEQSDDMTVIVARMV